METGVYPRYEEYTGDSPVQFVISLNKVRRHLSASQLAMVAVDCLPYYEQEAKKRQGTRTDLTLGKKLPNVKSDDNKSAAQAGEAVGMFCRYCKIAVAGKTPMIPKLRSGKEQEQI